MSTETTSKLHIRWMIRRDFAEVLVIEAESFEHPWQEEDLIRCGRQRNCIGMICERDDHLQGYMVYELHKTRLHVLNFAVAEESRLQGVGRAMVKKLVSKLNPDRRNRILLEVSEPNLDAQLFFKACGFRAVAVVRDFYQDTDDSAYVMQYRVGPKQANRIAEHCP